MMKSIFNFKLSIMVILATGSYAQTPLASFTSSRTNVCPLFAITFTDQSTNSPTGWTWSFPGGSPANSVAQNPVVTYAQPGNYTVTLVATNASGSDDTTITGLITVQQCRISSGIYRIPYQDGTQVNVSGDHLTHSPSPLRIDMSGTGGTAPYKIVAAADGWIKAIVDSFSGCCNQFGNCSDCNNYVWIAHPNGEWTKYTHFRTGTVTGASFANLSLNQFVCAGTYLGDEGDVGASSGGGRAGVACDGNTALQNSIDSLNTIRIANGGDSIRCAVHLHFEVGIPDDTADAFTTAGGFLKGQNLIPVICDVPGNIFVDGSQVTANPCDVTSCVDDLLLQNQDFNTGEIGVFQADNEITAQNNFEVNANGNVLMQAGERITLKPGFSANANSFFIARIDGCNQFPGAICNAGARVAIEESEIQNLGTKIIETGLVTYPNPVTEILNIVYMIGESVTVNFKVVNIYGQEMLRLDENTVRETGTVHRLKMNTGIMPPGTYYCILQAGREVKVSRFVKVD